MSNFIILDTENLDQLAQRLKKYMTLRARIITCLGNGRYILRFLGSNFVMRSDLAFKNQEEIDLKIMEVFPHVTFKYLRNGNGYKMFNRSQQLTDILI